MWLPNLENDAKNPINAVGDMQSDNGFRRGKDAGLTQIANAMQLIEGQITEVNSIPDIYYGASRFSMSLFYRDDGFLRNFAYDAKKEWRALLAVCVTSGIALEGSGYKILSVPINNPDPNKNNYTEAALNLKPSTGIWKPREYIPVKSIGVKAADSWTWDSMKAIVLRNEDVGIEDVTIAFTSPVTILYPAADWYRKISERCPDVFPWVFIDHFLDPSDTDVRAQPQRMAYLVDWLEDFRMFLRKTEAALDADDIKKFEILKNDWFVRLCNQPGPNAGPDESLLSEFRNELQKTYDLKQNGNLDDAWKTWDFNGTHNYLSDSSIASILPEAPRIPDSNVYTEVLVAGITIADKPVLYLDESSSGRIAAGVYTVGDVLSRPSLRQEIEKSFSILASNDIFLDKVYYSNYIMIDTMNIENQATPQELQRDYFTCVDDCCFFVDYNDQRLNICFMPLTEKGLELVKAGGNYSMHPKLEGGLMSEIEVSFSLVLENGEHMPPIKKTFESGQHVQLSYSNVLPIAAVWPGVNVGQFWKRYWVFCYNTPDSEVDSGEKQSPKTVCYSLKPTEYLEEVLPDVVAISSDKPGHKYYHMDKFPAFMELGANGQTVGYIKTKEQYITPTRLEEYVFSLDFGTASTVLYGMAGNGTRSLSEAGGDYGGIKLGSSNIIGIPLGLARERSTYLSKYFIRDVEMPFATLLHDYYPDNLHADRYQYRTSHIYHKELLKRDQRAIDDNKVISNLKWAQGVNQKHIAVFFVDLFGLPLLDAVANGLTSLDGLTVRASYPDSMQPHIRLGYENTIKNGIAKSAKWFTNLTGTAKTEFVTESEAAARYFISRMKAKSMTPSRLCVIDIGGGTSDIYYTETYSDRENGGKVTLRAIESSLKIGARDILVKALYESTYNSQQNNGKNYKEYYLYELMMAADMLTYDDIGNPNAPLGRDDITKLLAQTEAYTFAANWEGLLNRKYKKDGEDTTLGKELLSYWKDPAQIRSARDKKVLSAIAINLGSIAYYAAMLLRESRNNDPTVSLHVAFAGNGSKMLDWLGSKDTYQHFFSSIMMSALSFGKKDMPLSIEIHPSEHRKLEAAEGMFRQGNRGELNAATKEITDKDGTLKALPIIIAGERFVGREALTVEKCEELLKSAYERRNDNARSVFEQSKNKVDAYGQSCVNEAVCDLSERDIVNDDLQVKDIETGEFDNFIEAYNQAIHEFPDSSLLPVEMAKIETSGRSGRITINWNKWHESRQSNIDKYISRTIQAVRSDSQRPDELESFFLMEIKALNEWVMQQL